MANLSITSVCNRRCQYCFAMETLDQTPRDELHMSPEIFERSLQFLKRSGRDDVRLLGGEPTLHPRFGQMIDRALELDFRLMIFSGGLIPPRVLQRLEQIPAQRLTVLLNIAVPGEDRDYEVARQPEVMRRLGSRVLLGLNIHSPSVKLDFLLDLIAEHALMPVIRLGLAHPILAGENRFLHPRHYPEVGRRVTAFARRCRAEQVSIEFDCGWVPCMFPVGVMEEFGWTANEIGLRCSPILDVLSNGEVISCYPLASHHRLPLPDDRDTAWLHEEFRDRQESERSMMLFAECAECPWRARGECTGGCLAGSMRRQRGSSFTFSTAPSAAASEEPRRPAPVAPIARPLLQINRSSRGDR